MGTACTYHGNSWKGMAIPNGGINPWPSASKDSEDRVAKGGTVTMDVEII